ncbi:MAG: hypothetical protein ACTHZ5_13460 [Micrococcaceae bacterium]
MTSKITTPLRSLRLLTFASIVGLGLTACSSDAEGEPEPSETVTVTAEPTEADPSESESDHAESSEEPDEDASETAGSGDTSATETFTSQGGTYTFEIPEGWTAETTEYDASSNEFNGVAKESVRIASPLGDIEVFSRLHAGPVDADGWRSQHWQTVDLEEHELPKTDGAEHVYLRSNVEWLGENDVDVDHERSGWGDNEYRLNVSIISTEVSLAEGDSDPADREGWAYVAPLPGNYEGGVAFIGAVFDQELMEYLTGASGREDTVAAFLENEWYQTAMDILRSVEYREPAAEDLPFTE